MAPSPIALACGWINAHLAAFHVERKRESLAASIKAVAELAHAADFLLRSADAEQSALGHAWIEQAWAALEQGELLRELVASNPRLLPFGAAFLPFHLCGYRNEALRSTLAAQAQRAHLGPLNWTLVVPVLRLLAIEPSSQMEDQARLCSVLHNQTSAAAMPPDAVYVLLHECLYASAYGRHAPRGSEQVTAYLRAVLPALVSRFVDLPDSDILAELILVSQVLGLHDVNGRAHQRLVAAQIPDGSVMAIESNTAQPTILPRPVHPGLPRSYHTTLVAIMAWTARPVRSEPRDHGTTSNKQAS